MQQKSCTDLACTHTHTHTHTHKAYTVCTHTHMHKHMAMMSCTMYVMRFSIILNDMQTWSENGNTLLLFVPPSPLPPSPLSPASTDIKKVPFRTELLVVSALSHITLCQTCLLKIPFLRERIYPLFTSPLNKICQLVHKVNSASYTLASWAVSHADTQMEILYFTFCLPLN